MKEANKHICFCIGCEWEGEYEETYEMEGQTTCPKCHEPSVTLDPYICEECDYVCDGDSRDEDGNCTECGGKMTGKNHSN